MRPISNRLIRIALRFGALCIFLSVASTQPKALAQTSLEQTPTVYSGGSANHGVPDRPTQPGGATAPNWHSLQATSGAISSGTNSSGTHMQGRLERQSNPAPGNFPNPVVTANYQQPAVNPPASISNANSDVGEAKKGTPLAPPTDSLKRSSTKSGGAFQSIISIGSSLLIVIGLFLGATWCYRKTVNTPLSGGIPGQVVKVLGRTPLAARQQLVLVRFGSKLVLVSLVQGEARTISEITDPLEVDQLAGFCESQTAGSAMQSFRQVLHQGVAK